MQLRAGDVVLEIYVRIILSCMISNLLIQALLDMRYCSSYCVLEMGLSCSNPFVLCKATRWIFYDDIFFIYRNQQKFRIAE